MKKNFVLAMAVIVALGSVKALAGSGLSADEALKMNMDSKIEAAMADSAKQDQTRPIAKMDAADFADTMSSIRRQVKELARIQDSLRNSENSGHLIGDIGQTITVLNEEIPEIQAKQDAQAAHSRNIELAKLIREIKAGMMENQIMGLNVNSNLDF